MTLTRLRQLAINQSADGVELEASTLIYLLDTIDCLKAALEKMLITGALELYVSQFQKPTEPKQNATGIMDKVYNREQMMRVEIAVNEARAALAKLETESKGE